MGIVPSDVLSFDDELGGVIVLSDVQNLNIPMQDSIATLNHGDCL